MSQLGLFGAAGGIEPHVTDEDRAIAGRVPGFVRFGTSSWSFPGWKGIVWRGEPTEAALAREGLGAYARHPLFRTVSLDRAHYAPLRDEDLAAYAAQLEGAPSFRVVSKVWDELTTAVFPKHPRYGARAGTVNPHFLDVERFASEVAAPYARSFAAYAGPFVLELTPMPRGALDERTLSRKVEDFLSRAPSGFRYAFELRNAELLGARWLDTLRAHGAAHVFNYWTAMPPLSAQLRAGSHVSSFMVMRLMLPPFARYEDKKVAFAPFDRIAAPQPEMRDDVLAILAAAEEAGCEDAFVLVNNKAEGSAPLTVRALASRLAAR